MPRARLLTLLGLGERLGLGHGHNKKNSNTLLLGCGACRRRLCHPLSSQTLTNHDGDRAEEKRRPPKAATSAQQVAATLRELVDNLLGLRHLLHNSLDLLADLWPEELNVGRPCQLQR